jgi:DNA-directed RNA polymerase specialized sigma24 family protein
MATQALALLELDWSLLVGRRWVRDAVARWRREDPALARVRCLDDVLRLTALGRDPAASDAVLVALVRRAPRDDLAARAVLQALRPGLLRVAQRVGALRDPDATAELVAVALERIRCYPLERRPCHVAANVVLDVLNAACRHARRPELCELPTDPHDLRVEDEPEPEVDPSASRPDPEKLIAAALAAGTVQESDAAIVRDMFVAGTPLSTAAAAAGVSWNAMRGRRTRARRRVAEACSELAL